MPKEHARIWQCVSGSSAAAQLPRTLIYLSIAQFGDGATLNPANLIDSSRFEVKTADATISLDPEHSYLVEARIIDGRKYLLIPADEDIEVNGFGVRVKGEYRATRTIVSRPIVLWIRKNLLKPFKPDTSAMTV